MDKRVKHPSETRIEAARLFDAGFGFNAVAKALGIPGGTGRAWLDKHKQGLLLGLDAMSSNKAYSTDLKVAAVERFLSGVPKPDVLVEFGISNRSLFNKWVARYRASGPDGLVAQTRGPKPKSTVKASVSDAEKIRLLEMEVEVLKKYNALLAEEDLKLRTKRR